MGGRGGAGGSGGGGVSSSKIAPFTAPEMKYGSEKQKSWARSIISGPHESLIGQAKVQKNFVDHLAKRGVSGGDRAKELSAITAAANRYKSEIAKLEKKSGGKLNDARWVIDHRSIFASAANTLLKDEKKKRNLD